MREVFGVSSGGQVQEGGVKMSSSPGYLELSEEMAARLISQQPIEELYEVEEQPFARGKYAAVRLCRHRQSGQRFAAKFLRKRRRSTDLRPEILHEVAILDACSSSPRIVQLHHVFENAHEMILLLELAPGGELQMLLDRDEVPEERQVKRLMRQILDGLVYLHSINVAHLDIKPQNLVLMDDFPRGEVKLCDLGISRYISDGADIRDILGTPDYVAPEVLNYEPISLATDMWSVGVLLYVLLTGCSPFGGDTKQETFCNISQCNLDFPEDLFEDVSEEAKDLMRKLMVKEPSKRLTAAQCLDHRWFTGVESVPKLGPAVPCKTVEAALTKAEEVRVKRSPLVVRKPEAEVSESLEIRDKILMRPPATKNGLSTSASVTTSPRENSLACSKTNSNSHTSISPSEKGLSEKKDESNLNDRGSSGMRSFRKNNFMKNMGSIVARVAEIEATDNKRNNNMVDNVAAKPTPRSTSGLKVPMPETPLSNTSASFSTARPINKATAMQTMPVNSINGYTFDRPCKVNHALATVNNVQKQNRNGTSADSARRRVLDNKDCVYQFRKCYIVDDSEDDGTGAPAAISLSIDGTNDSETSSGYFDYSSSCSSTDSVSDVSETSVDRLSTASTDDSLEYDYTKNERRQYIRTPVPAYATQNRNVWQMGTVTLGHKPREERLLNSSTNPSYARAFARFSSIPSDTHKLSLPSKVSTQDSVFASARKQAAKAAHTSVINKVTMSSSLHHTSVMNRMSLASLRLPNVKCSPTVKDIGINIEHVRNGNQVVLREVKGGKCSRFSEVKCESVQSRIRKFEV